MKRIKSLKLFSCTALMLAALLLCADASALNVQTFKPKAAGSGILTLPGSTPLAKGNYSLGALYNYSYNSLEYSDIGLPSGQGLVKHLNTINFIMAYGLADWATLHLDVPLHILSSIDDISAGFSKLGAGIGDLELSALLNIRKSMLGDERRLGVAFMPFMTFNTGSLSKYLSDDGISAGFKFVADYPISNGHYIAANLGLRFRPDELVGSLDLNDDILYGVGYQGLLSERMKLSIFTEIYGAITVDEFDTRQQEMSSPVEALLGFKKTWASNESFNWVFGAGHGFFGAYGTPDIRLFGGLMYSPVAKKAEPKVEPVAAPVAVKNGKLGLNIMNEKKAKVEGDVTVTDASGNLVQSVKGSKVNMELAPGKYNYEVKAEGYRTDKGEFEIAQAEELKKEITLLPPSVVLTKTKIEVNQVIYFDTAKATIKDVSKPVLDEVADLLKANPDINKIRIEGHTDTTGTKEFNAQLSNDRAKSVSDFISSKGIDPTRLDSKGFGQEKPIADNATKEGRSKNRRVEFVIVEKE